MALVHYPFRDLHCWEENECLNYYSLLSHHEVYDVVGSQLTETDIEVLSFLLNETASMPHPLDPAGWNVEPSEDDPNDMGVSPSANLLKVWQRLNANASTSPQPLFASHKPSSGLELLLELERSGYISEGNLEPLLQLLRVLTRHDLLPFVSHKKRRTVSPERLRHWPGAQRRGPVCPLGMRQNCRATETPLSSFTQQCRSGFYSPTPGTGGTPAQKRRRKRGNGWSRKPKKTNKPSLPLPPLPPPKVSCGKNKIFISSLVLCYPLFLLHRMSLFYSLFFTDTFQFHLCFLKFSLHFSINIIFSSVEYFKPQLLWGSVLTQHTHLSCACSVTF